MGASISYISRLFTWREAKVLMLGLDGAGKTTILYQLKLGTRVETVPTMGFVYETIQHRGVRLSVWDVAGQDALRSLWRHYYHGACALVFVIDSSDRRRLSVARDELHKILADEELREAAVLVLLNKSDLDGCGVEEARGILEFSRVRNTRKRLASVSALKGNGIREALDWLADNI